MSGDHEGWRPVKSRTLTQYSVAFRHGFLEIPLTATLENCTRESSTDGRAFECYKVRKA